MYLRKTLCYYMCGGLREGNCRYASGILAASLMIQKETQGARAATSIITFAKLKFFLDNSIDANTLEQPLRH